MGMPGMQGMPDLSALGDQGMSPQQMANILAALPEAQRNQVGGR
jgi:hypothetical protein